VGRKQVTSWSALLSVAEAAVLLGIDRATCYRAIRNDTFPVPVVRLGGRIRIPRRAVERLLDGAQPTAGSQSPQLTPAVDSCPVCGSLTPVAASSPSRRRPICSAARRSSPTITSV
jgi:excisionase family DNA binding protein